MHSLERQGSKLVLPSPHKVPQIPAILKGLWLPGASGLLCLSSIWKVRKTLITFGEGRMS
jgi:hypothetical protein